MHNGSWVSFCVGQWVMACDPLFTLHRGPSTVDHVRHFAATSFSLLQQSCAVDSGIFYMAGVDIFLLVN